MNKIISFDSQKEEPDVNYNEFNYHILAKSAREKPITKIN